MNDSNGKEFGMPPDQTKIESYAAAPVNMNRKQRWKPSAKAMIISASVLAVIAVGVFLLIRFVLPNNAEGYYKDTKWGMTFAEVKEKVPQTAIFSPKGNLIGLTIDNYDGQENADAIVTYDFESDSLYNVMILITSTSSDSTMMQQIFDFHKQDLIKKHGNYSEPEKNFLVWTTSKSEIELVYYNSKTVILDYKDLSASN